MIVVVVVVVVGGGGEDRREREIATTANATIYTEILTVVPVGRLWPRNTLSASRDTASHRQKHREDCGRWQADTFRVCRLRRCEA
jgi:hypothetical protein